MQHQQEQTTTATSSSSSDRVPNEQSGYMLSGSFVPFAVCIWVSGPWITQWPGTLHSFIFLLHNYIRICSFGRVNNKFLPGCAVQHVYDQRRRQNRVNANASYNNLFHVSHILQYLSSLVMFWTSCARLVYVCVCHRITRHTQSAKDHRIDFRWHPLNDMYIFVASSDAAFLSCQCRWM